MVTQTRLITDEGPAVHRAHPLRRRGLDGVRQEVPAAQDQPRDASVQDGGQEHPIKVQSIRRGQGSECPVHCQQHGEVRREQEIRSLRLQV